MIIIYHYLKLKEMINLSYKKFNVNIYYYNLLSY
jgi:hypothetical protein